MMGIFSLFAKPLGFVMQWVYQLVGGYVLAILVFTLLIKVVLFPLSIKNQKSQADRARLAPRLERIQKKYAGDRQKLQEKQQQLYQKEGVSMTGGCLPMVLQMLVLFSVIAVIYKPLTYIQRIPAEQITACVTVVKDDLMAPIKADLESQNLSKEDFDKKLKAEEKKIDQKYSAESYYGELNLMKVMDKYSDQMVKALEKNCNLTNIKATEIITNMESTRDEFAVFGISLLDMPNYTGIRPNWLWLIAIASGVAALFQSIISMKYSKAAMSAEQQQMAGCSNNAMMYSMPIMSLVIAFTVPGGVALYWTFSNLLGIAQTAILNKMYNPAKAREQAEIEYAERRRKKQEDKERLRAARLAEQAAWQKEENEKRLAAQGKGKKKPAEDTEEKPVDETPAEPVDDVPTEE